MKTRSLFHLVDRHTISAIPTKRILLWVGLFILGSSLLLACDPAAEDTPAEDTQPNTEVPAPPTDTLPADTEEPADTLPEENFLVFTESDPCKYLTQEQVEQVLSELVTDTIPADSDTLRSCTYIAKPGEQFVTIAVYQGEAAKLYLLSEIAQLQNDCSVSYSFSTNPEEPTPLPPEVQALMSSTLPELFVMDLEVQTGCGGSYQALPELGSNVYTFQTFIMGAIIGIASDDIYVTFLYADVGLDAEQSLAVVEELVQIAILEN